MTDEYTKQLEAENEKLRSEMEKRDATLYELVRKKLEVKKDKDGRFYLRVKNNKDLHQLTDNEVLMLTGIDTEIVTPMEFPTLSINDIVSVQPMMSNTTFQDFVSAFGLPYKTTGSSTSKSSIANFSSMTMPVIRKQMSSDEVQKEVEKLQAHQKLVEEMNKKAEEEGI